MSEYRTTSPDDLYFVTLTIEGWVDLFSRKVYKDIIIENLKYCQQKEGSEIFSYDTGYLLGHRLHTLQCRSIIHLLLVIAIIAVLLRIIKGDF